MLSPKQLQNVCCQWQGADQCRYLETNSSTKCCCLKKTGLKAAIDKKVEDYKKDQKAKKQDPSLHGVPIGDNCSGYFYLQNKLQGFDVKK